ncbi:DMT family transporter [Yoonia sp. BS5-3]|uniref:DMT family transporter n=1 Tax=Yoonia phaeophyticola TaxID=3137369 RepID=A0ABZ2UZC6_9RHOB
MENLRGAAFMVLAMLSFAIEDALIKNLSATLPAGQILLVICVGGAVSFWIWFAVRGIPVWQPEYLNPKVLLRSFCDAAGSCLFITALSLIPLTTASAVIQATPLVVAMGAALFLGQPVGWRRWLAILIGFAGVLIIIRPGMDGFVPATLLAVAGMLGLAARDLLTRSLSVGLSAPQLAFHTFVTIIPASLLLMALQGQSSVAPNGTQIALLLGCIIIVIIAYLALVAATRTGNAGIISSFRYSRMIFALILGYLVFAEVPDLPTLIGATIIIASGIFTLWREARLRHTSPQPEPAL